MNMRNRVSICTLIPEELTHRSDFMLPDAKRFELEVSSEALCHAVGLANKELEAW